MTFMTQIETPIDVSTLQSIYKIFDSTLHSQFAWKQDAELESAITHISRYFQISHSQAVWVSLVFALNFEHGNVDLRTIMSHLDCKFVDLLTYKKDFDALCEANILAKSENRRRAKSSFANTQYSIYSNIIECIIDEKPIIHKTALKENDVISILETIYKMGIRRNDEEIDSITLIINTKFLVSNHLHFPLFKSVENLDLEGIDLYLLLYMIWKALDGMMSVDISTTIDYIFDSSSEKIRYHQQMLLGENLLVQKNLVEIVEARFYNDAELKLGDSVLQMIKENGFQIMSNKDKPTNHIEPDAVNSTPLYYDKATQDQIELVQKSLSEQCFATLQSRLKDSGLPTGITVLLHGVPGTGKTETVKHIAKATNRTIIKVDISSSKSKWYGESEKLIKKIFDDYKYYAKKSKTKPILLFNEADAILSKRKTITNDSNVSQTENAIQNILLEEIENFDGILMATTNLTDNFDKAFERRFLFKIQYAQPSINIKTKIWQSKLSFLKQTEAKLLAEKYDFSGGQIENILRKSSIHNIVHDSVVNLSIIEQFCQEEQLSVSEQKNVIGFKAGQSK